MSTENFYANLPATDSLLSAIDFKRFVAVPADWFIVITDITGSTKAIEAGRYKEVNLLGACSIAAVLNAVKPLEVPYVFGGDGASFVLPASQLEAIKPPLLGLQRTALKEFDLDLRVGIVPVQTVLQAGFQVNLSKLKISENYAQAAFVGGGLSYANDLVKAATTAQHYQLNQADAADADLTGLECRWQDIPSRHGETVALLVMAMAHNATENNLIYRAAVEKIHEIYGSDADFHPVSTRNLTLMLHSRRLALEVKVRSPHAGPFARWLHQSQVQAENLLGWALMGLGLKLGGTDWGSYRRTVQAASDYQKFDDMLRMIIAGNAAQRQRLTEYLETQYLKGKLTYGLHVSNRALMTCLVFERSGQQVHFVDGADGGYSLAAKVLKQQLHRKATNWHTYRRLLARRQTLIRRQHL